MARKEVGASRKEGVKALTPGRRGVDHRPMVDLLLLLVLAAFFGLSLAFVRACERIIGPDVAETPAEPSADGERAAA